MRSKYGAAKKVFTFLFVVLYRLSVYAEIAQSATASWLVNDERGLVAAI